jgi:hypothetical protein
MYVAMLLYMLSTIEGMLSATTPKPMSKRGMRIVKGGTKHERQMRHGSEHRMTHYRAWPMWNSEQWQRIPTNNVVTKHANRDYYRANMPGLASKRRHVEAIDADELLYEAVGLLTDHAIDTSEPLYYFDANYWQQERAFEELYDGMDYEDIEFN